MKKELWYDLKLGSFWSVGFAAGFLLGELLKVYWSQALTGAVIGFLFFGWRYDVRGES